MPQTVTDFNVTDDGSIITIVATTEPAKDWIRDNVPDTIDMGIECFVHAERRYAFPIMADITRAELTMSLDGREFSVEER